MYPFYFVKDGQGRDRRQHWESKTANFKLKQIEKKIEAELNAEDCAKAKAAGVGHLIKDGMLATCEWHGDDTDGVYGINPVASSIKHSGEMTTRMVRKAWRQFCSKPQDEEAAVQEMYAVEDIDDQDEPQQKPLPTPEMTPIKRGPGRPPRSKGIPAEMLS